MRRPLTLAAIAIPLAAASFAACGGSGSETTQGAGAASSSGVGGTGGAGNGGEGLGGDIFGDGGLGQLVSIDVTPKDLVIEVVNGQIPPPITYKAVGTTSTGSIVDVVGSWTYDRGDIGSIVPASGAFTASGLLGGTGNVTFEAEGVKGSTTATVKLRYLDDSQMIDPNVKAQFPTAVEADPALTLLYPYDKTVFPRGLLGPTIQWNGGNAGDVYHIHIKSPAFEYETWRTVPPPSRFDFPKLPDDIWRKLTDSTNGDVQVDIARFDGTKAYLAKTQTWKIAPANLAGTIYYWEVNTGSVVRIKPGDVAPEAFLTPPPGVGCVACHSVSKDGTRLVASFHGGYSPWGTFDTATGTSLFNTNASSGFQAISPNGSHVLWRHWNDGAFNSTGFLSLSTYDSDVELAQLNPGGGAPAHPAWSGDGQKIAFSVRTDGNGLDFTQSTLWVTDVNLAVPSFSNTKMIVPNDAGRPTVTFPTFSPDSKWIAFERSTMARSRGALAEIWLTNPDGSVVIPLDNTNGMGHIEAEQTTANYEPTFNPFSLGGYFWLVIVSERKYGNTLTDTNPNTRRKQLWVTAIDANPVAGQDPSHPAFWLPGQGLDNQNMRGEWAKSPCKQLGEGCNAGFDCCDGFCKPDAQSGALVCSDQAEGCSKLGEACMTAANCCDPDAKCIGGFCASDGPK
ncbi:hypothetical protein [Polyangium sp. y55x31]|uniref:TolB family protein n=1 Tax=Polyangium sp. y55x31 TaxID=3042688 RepID=UPI002482BDA3|nr:hypothetical protein [Polyangium sp. y55x31]MDI1482944.1 hypothetical protein [Polyangium sp. y55x31]